MGKGDFSEQARENSDLAKKRLLGAKPKPYQPVVGSGADGEKSLSPPVKPYPLLDEEAYYGVFGQIAKVTEISEGAFSRNISKTALDSAFSYLEASGLAVRRLEETSGRTAERWYLSRNKRI